MDALTTPAEAETAASTTTQTTPETQGTIRDLVRADRYFWRANVHDQLSLKVFDRDTNSHKRALPSNEIVVMALNEIAAVRGRGFFYHLLSREAWRTWPTEELHPRSRIPEGAGHRYPTIIYMNYVWSNASRAAFFQESHRGRYLKCNALVNPPPNSTPLYAIQYLASKRQAAYITPDPSLVLFATDDCFYLARTADLSNIIGPWPTSKKAPKGADPHARLDTAPWLWDGAITGGNIQKLAAMTVYKIDDIEKVYTAIVGQCTPSTLAATFDARDLEQVLPRPASSNPRDGQPLGTPLQDPSSSFQSANPPSIRGLKRKRKT